MGLGTKISDVEVAVLVELLDQLANHDAKHFGTDDIADLISYDVTSNFLETTVRNLEKSHLVEWNFIEEISKTLVSITGAGIKSVQDREENPKSDVSQYLLMRSSQSASGLTLSSLQVEATGKVTPPVDTSSDEHWTPLPVDRSRSGYGEMVSCLNKARDEIRKDNGYAEHHQEERNEILSNLDEGITKLESGDSVTRQFVETKLLAGLRRVSKVFSKAALEEVAKLAIKAIRLFFFGD